MMIDWWTVPGGTWGVKNLDFKVELTADKKSRPEYADSYNEHQIESWADGAWRFVMVRVVPVDRDWTDLVQFEQYLGCVEWGEMPEGGIDRGDLVEDQVLELARECVQDARAGGYAVEADEDSQFAREKLTAPF